MFKRKISIEIRNIIINRYLTGEKSSALAQEYGLCVAYPAQLVKQFAGGRFVCCPNCGTKIQAGSLQFKVLNNGFRLD